jgi:uncharacterized protein YyaL (SSP411 family)
VTYMFCVMTNRLTGSTSSYLKKAENEPIDWYPWCEDAFRRAKKEDKPILLSIGAVWCHWCHVMAHESWDNPGVARVINDRFIAIKVDRDERPDLDRYYQDAVSALAGTGGWPLTVFLTPEKEPFYGGTYFPDRPKHGMPGLIDVLLSVSDAYKNNRGSVKRTAARLTRLAQGATPMKGTPDAAMLDTALLTLKSNFDMANGGFGMAPKFPHSEVLLFLLLYFEGTGDRDAWLMADKTLRHMAAGGMYDQVGGGFHRYATDARWKVPHFEKMLTDNALLLRANIEAYRLSGQVYFKQVAEETLGFVFRRLARAPAGFSSSIDADLHGEEGGYFTWSEEEIRKLLGDRAEGFMKAYNVLPDGNFEVKGKNVLFIPGEADKSKYSIEKKALLDARNERDLPFIDKAIHTAWTSLMVTSLVTAYDALGDARSLDYAARTADFMGDSMYRDGTLYRIYTDRPSVDGFLDDYSCAIEALLRLYRSIQEPKYLELAIGMAEACDPKFYDREHGGYFYVQEKDRTPQTMDKPCIDLSVPAPNPQMALNLINLYHYSGEERYLDRAGEVLEAFAREAAAYPMGCGTYFSALDYYLHRPLEAVVEADRSEGLALARMVNGRVGKAIVLLDTGHGRRLSTFEGKTRVGGKPTIYFCEKGVCKAPMSDPAEIEKFLKKHR